MFIKLVINIYFVLYNILHHSIFYIKRYSFYGMLSGLKNRLFISNHTFLKILGIFKML